MSIHSISNNLLALHVILNILFAACLAPLNFYYTYMYAASKQSNVNKYNISVTICLIILTILGIMEAAVFGYGSPLKK